MYVAIGVAMQFLYVVHVGDMSQEYDLSSGQLH
jgi:hypothetical protein